MRDDVHPCGNRAQPPALWRIVAALGCACVLLICFAFAFARFLPFVVMVLAILFVAWLIWGQN